MAAIAWLHRPISEAIIKRNLKYYQFGTPEYGIDMDVVYRAARSRRLLHILFLFIAIIMIPLVFIAMNIPIFIAMNLFVGMIERWEFPTLFLLFTIFLSAMLIYTIFEAGIKWWVRHRYMKDADSGDFDLEKREHDSVESHRVVLCSNSKSFVGSGARIGGWVLNVDTRKKKNGDTISLSDTKLRDLVDDLERTIVNGMHAPSVNGALSESVVYVNTQYNFDDGDVVNLTKMSCGKALIDRVAKAYKNRRGAVRIYRQIRIEDWGSQSILSCLYRVNNISDNIIIDVNYFYLAPVISPQDLMDEKKLWSIKGFIRCLLMAAVLTFLSFPWFLVEVGRSIGRACSGGILGRLFARSRRVRPARVSLRELLARGEGSDMQVVDRIGFLKIIDQSILKSINEFCDAYDIDAEQFRDRQSVIINSGILVTGGQVSAQNMTAGHGNSLQENSMWSTLKAGSVSGK